MNRNDIDEILLINWYLVRKKLNSPNCEKVELMRKYLTIKINDLIKKKKSVNKSPILNILL